MSGIDVSRPAVETAFEPKLGGHLPILDAVRGVAIVMVMLYHFEMNAAGATRFPYRFMSFGWCGVDLFFVLSGFLITGILYDASSDTHYFRNFYMRRTLRIFPLYYATLAVIAIGVAIAIRRPHHTATLDRLAPAQWWVWVYGTNIKLALDGIWATFRGGSFELGHFWSLAVEEHFYLLWPAVVLLLGRKSLMRVCGVLVIAALALRGFFAWRDNLVAAYVLSPCRMDGLAIGAWIALAGRGEQGISWLRKWAFASVPLAAAVIIPLGIYYRQFDQFNPGVITVGCSALDLLFGAILILAITIDPQSRRGRMLAPAWLRSVGKYSYAIYVLHPFLNPSISRHLVPIRPQWLSIWTTIFLFCVLSYAIGWASWNLFERHFLKFKRFFPHSTREAPLANRQLIHSVDSHATSLAAGDPIGR